MATRYVRLVPYTSTEPAPRVVCPNGHTVVANGYTRTGDGVLVCRTIPPHGARQPCGATLYVVAGCRTPAGGPALYYAEVTRTELAHLEGAHASLEDVLCYLNETPMPATERAA